MGTIVKRGGSYRAVIRKKGHGTITKSFSRAALAKKWIADTEHKLEQKEIASRNVDVGQLFQRYIDEVLLIQREPSKDALKTARLMRKMTAGLGFEDLTGIDLVQWIKTHCKRAKPASVTRYISRIGSVLSLAETVWDYNVPWKEFRKAKAYLSKQGLSGQSKPRTRRLEGDELERILRKVSSKLPMFDIIQFSLLTGLRSNEVTRIKWEDLDRKKRLITIRNRKHPRQRIGNDSTIPLLGDAMGIILRQPAVSDRIFPYNSDSVEAAWRRARKGAGVNDLRWHDLRGEAISRLFESGYTIEQVALVSGHHSWNSLKIYTRLKPEDLHRD